MDKNMDKILDNNKVMDTDIRPLHPSDIPALYRICLLTGDSGQDARAVFGDPDLLGHYYAGPYAVLEPRFCLVLTQAGQPVGYIIGTPDSKAFAKACETDWFPLLRRRYLPDSCTPGSRDASMVKLIHEGYSAPAGTRDYPAHLHIDILPQAQGGGNGRRLMDGFLELLRSAGCPGVHLGVGESNDRGIRFYEHYGFTSLQLHTGWRLMGLRL